MTTRLNVQAGPGRRVPLPGTPHGVAPHAGDTPASVSVIRTGYIEDRLREGDLFEVDPPQPVPAAAAAPPAKKE